MSLKPDTTVFRGVRVFDGRTPALTGPSDVVVRGVTIESVAPPRRNRSRPARRSGPLTAAAGC